MKLPSKHPRAIAAWFEHEVIARYGLLRAVRSDYGKEFEEEFLTKRNVRMVERLIPLVKKEPTFIAVGALHLPGEDGILALLEKEGYTIKPVK